MQSQVSADPSDSLPLARRLHLAGLAEQLPLLGDVRQKLQVVRVKRLAVTPGELARVEVHGVPLDAAEVREIVLTTLTQRLLVAAKDHVVP